jgi:hypothetical protein
VQSANQQCAITFECLRTWCDFDGLLLNLIAQRLLANSLATGIIAGQVLQIVE